MCRVDSGSDSDADSDPDGGGGRNPDLDPDANTNPDPDSNTNPDPDPTTDKDEDPITYQAVRRDGTCRLRRVEGETRWLTTGFNGGERVANAAYNLTVPEGWGEAGQRDLKAYATERVRDAKLFAGGDAAGELGPALLTGVDQTHARVARLDGATVLATAGVSNPAVLPVCDTNQHQRSQAPSTAAPSPGDGTVNLLVGVDRPLEPGALANLVAVTAEAKATTLLATVGVPGTTSDAVIVGCPPTEGASDREPAAFSGAATPVGAAVRASVRDAIVASLRSRYGADLADAPTSLTEATYGVSTDRSATVSTPASASGSGSASTSTSTSTSLNHNTDTE